MQRDPDMWRAETERCTWRGVCGGSLWERGEVARRVGVAGQALSPWGPGVLGGLGRKGLGPQGRAGLGMEQVRVRASGPLPGLLAWRPWSWGQVSCFSRPSS